MAPCLTGVWNDGWHPCSTRRAWSFSANTLTRCPASTTVSLSPEVRDWCSIMPKSASLRGAYRSRKTDCNHLENEAAIRVPQSFTFMARSQMPGQGREIQVDAAVPKRLRQTKDEWDIFCMVKLFMSDTLLCQPPLLVYPQAFSASTESFWNRVNCTKAVLKQSLDESRSEQLRELAQEIENYFPNLSRSVAYIRSLLDPARPRKPYERLKFVDAGPNELDTRVYQLRAQPGAPKPHKLEVVFHHAQG